MHTGIHDIEVKKTVGYNSVACHCNSYHRAQVYALVLNASHFPADIHTKLTSVTLYGSLLIK